MSKLKKITCMLLLSVGFTSAVYAGPYADQLEQCALKNVTQNDRKVTAQWLFSVFAAHPDMAEASKMTNQQMQQYDKAFADLLTRLLTKDCSQELKNVVMHEGLAAMETSMGNLGMLLAEQIMSDPKIFSRAEGFVEYMDESAFEKLFD